MKHIGCGSNSCIFGPPNGVGTNGSCMCFSNRETWIEGKWALGRKAQRELMTKIRMQTQRIKELERELKEKKEPRDGA